MKEHPKLTVGAAIKPRCLQQSVHSNLEMVHAYLNSKFEGFLKHALTVANAFEIIDNGLSSKTRGSKTRGTTHATNNRAAASQNETESASSAAFQKSVTWGATSHRPPIFCHHPPCQLEEKCHWIEDCTLSTDEEKKALKATIAFRKTADGLARSKRSQKPKQNQGSSGTVGRLHPASNSQFSVTV